MRQRAVLLFGYADLYPLTANNYVERFSHVLWHVLVGLDIVYVLRISND